MRKSARVEKITQRIDADLLTELTQYPSQVERFFTDNYVSRTLSYLVGFDEDLRARVIKTTQSGELKVAITASGFETYDVFNGTTQDDYDSTTTYIFGQAYSRFDILIEDNDAIISFGYKGGTWGKDIILPVGYHSIDITAYGIRVKSRTAGSPATYQIVVYR
jgi:hypothetical protein